MTKNRFIINAIICLIVSIAAIVISIFHSFSLSFFFWGDNEAYVIWEPLVVYFIIPGLSVLGIVKLLLLGKTKLYLRFSVLLCVVLFYIPSLVGFDSSENLMGRWVGFINGFLILCMMILDFNISRLELKKI